MAPGQSDREPLNLEMFWRLYTRLVGRLLTEKAHAEVVLIIQEGAIRQVRVNRSYLPRDLPKE